MTTTVGTRALSELARHDYMPVILDGVIRATRKQASDHGPFVAVKAVRC